jgi:hypothetical protein
VTVTWHLRGFDKATEFEAVDFDIPRELLPMVRQLLPDVRDDPDFIDPHEITRDQTARLAEAMALAIDPDRYFWSVESNEDPYVVAAQVDAMRAGT